MPVKAEKNIVLVVCPLNSIIEDQLKVLKDRGVSADVLQLVRDDSADCESLFCSEKDDHDRENSTAAADLKLKSPSKKLVKGDIQIIFSHPEALLSKEGRELMKTQVFKRNLVACVVDEAHCVELVRCKSCDF